MTQKLPSLARTSLRLVLLFLGLMTFLTWRLANNFVFFEIFSNFYPQFFQASLLILVGLLLARLWKEALGMSVLVCFFGVAVLPYLTASVDEPAEEQIAATVLQYNILFWNDDLDAIATVVRDADADVVGLHELTKAQWDVLGPELSAEYPHQIALPSGLGPGKSRGGGKAILSKTPLANVEVDFDLELEGTFIPPLAATTEIDGQEVLAIALHPSPSRTGAKRIFERQEKLLVVRQLVDVYAGPAIIIADLNIAPTSPRYHSFLDSIGWDDPRKDVGIDPTYNLRGVPGIGLAIDHVLVSPDIDVLDYEVGPSGGSDHRSLLATIGWA